MGVGEDTETLAHLLQAYFQGFGIEWCEPKEANRLVITGTLVALGTTAASCGVVNAAVSAGTTWALDQAKEEAKRKAREWWENRRRNSWWG